MEIFQLPVLRDNYIYLLHDSESGSTAVIDPAEADPVIRFLDARGWKLTHILNTHHHSDHVGGNPKLKEVSGCRIYGRSLEGESIPCLDESVAEGQSLMIGGTRIEVLELPGHTRSHVAYWLPDESALFSGDTLFGMGCGRLLGGTAAELWASLQRIRQLPEETLVYCTHEYTYNNGLFASYVEASNQKIAGRMQQIRAMRLRGESTVPFTLREELMTNPFLRPDSPAIRKHFGLPVASDLEVFSEMRRLKDNFHAVRTPASDA